MQDLIHIHKSILNQYLIGVGYKKNKAQTRLQAYDESEPKSDIYITKDEFYRLLITCFFMSLDTLYNINQHMSFHQYLDDFKNYLNIYGLNILIEHDDYPDDEELSIFPSELLKYYDKISQAIFSKKISDINTFYITFLESLDININIDLSSKKRMETSIVDAFKSIKHFVESNKGADQLYLESITFNYIYTIIMSSTNINIDVLLAYLGKIYYDSFSYDLPYHGMDAHYFEDLENHLHVIECLFNHTEEIKKQTLINLYVSLLRANNYFDIDDSRTSPLYPSKHMLLSPGDRYAQIRVNQTLITIESKIKNYNKEHIFLAIKQNLLRIDDFFLLVMFGNEIDRGSKNEYIHNEYKRIFEKFHLRITDLKISTLSSIDHWFEVLSDEERKFISDDTKNILDDFSLKQKELIKSIEFDCENIYLDILKLEKDKMAFLKTILPFEVDEDGFELADSHLFTLESYLKTNYLEYYSLEITEQMLNRYHELIEIEKKKIIDMYASQLDTVIKQTGYNDEQFYIERAINKIINKRNPLFKQDISLSLQRDYINQLSKKSEFIKLYATSEFMYKTHIEDAISYENMELTPLVTGLLKGTEQMLKAFIEWYHYNHTSFYTDNIMGQNREYLISEETWKEKLTIGNLSQHIMSNILPIILLKNNLMHLQHKIIRAIQIWNNEIRNSKFHHSNIYAYDTNLEYIFDESYHIVRIIINLMHLC